MSPAEVRQMTDTQIVEMLVNLSPSGDKAAVAWLASVISSPAHAEGVNELSRRYSAASAGRHRLPRAKHADSVFIDGAKFKQFFFMRRMALREIGPLIGKCEGIGSVLAHKGRMSFWTADAIANELGMHVDAFIAQVGTAIELERLNLV